jgi:ABC-type Fe3+/spermidine/putrescine transport system ATPase subunit
MNTIVLRQGLTAKSRRTGSPSGEMKLPVDDATLRNDSEFAVEVLRATKQFGGSVKALDDVTICAKKGQFITILGQSGSGKTTLLRIISGLEQPTEIEALRIGGRDVLHTPPHKRNVATVFQHYALFPHMTVGENIEYGLKLKGVDSAARRKRAQDMLDTVRLPGKYDRRVHQLSGGEKQRVALARSIVIEPDVLLLDEPISALDESLRADMQIELASLQRRLNMTFVYITHSQEEALTMSDTIVLMRRGKIAQEGSPSDLFERPCSSFVGSFMGVENVVSGDVVSVDGHRVAIVANGHHLAGHWTGTEQAQRGQRASVLLRAEKVRRVHAGQQSSGLTLTGKTTASVYKGMSIDHIIETPLGPIHARWPERGETASTVTIAWDEADAKVAPIAD